jgi:hypothetical protein
MLAAMAITLEDQVLMAVTVVLGERRKRGKEGRKREKKRGKRREREGKRKKRRKGRKTEKGPCLATQWTFPTLPWC